MVQTTLDTAVLKAALLQLAQEDPAFFQHLLAVLPNGEGGMNGVMDSPAPNYGIPNPKLDALIQQNFERYDDTFRKLA
jgi:hypothetical protein